MKKSAITVPLLLVIGLCVGCDKGKDEVLPNGIKVFGQRTSKNGTVSVRSVEFPHGEKKIDDTQFPDGTEKAARVEYPNGEKDYDVTWLADGSKAIGRATYPDGTEKRNVVVPRVLSVYGLQVGQTQAEAAAQLKEHGFSELQDCEQKAEVTTCGSKADAGSIALDFRTDGKLTHAKLSWMKDDSFNKLREEITSLGKESSHQNPETLVPESWTWESNEKSPCPNFTENQCPAVKIELVWYKSTGEVELTGNALLAEGEEVIDPNAPRPKVTHPIYFAGLHGGQTLDEVRAILRTHKYPPLTCKPDKSEVECTTKTAPGELRLTFFHQRLESLNSAAPDNQYDNEYDALCKELGEPTTYRGKVGRKKGDGVFNWDSAQTIPAMTGNKQVPAETLIFSAEEGKSKITYMYWPLMQEEITESAKIEQIRYRLAGHDLLFMPSKYYITGDGYYMAFGSAYVKDKPKTVPLLLACKVGYGDCHGLKMNDSFLGRYAPGQGIQFIRLETASQDALTFFKLDSSMARGIPSWMWHYE